MPAANKLALTSSMFISGICTVCPPGKVIVCIGKIEPIPPICLGKGVSNGCITGKVGGTGRVGKSILSLVPLNNLSKNDIFYEGLAWPLKVSITLYITSMPLSLSSSKLGTKLIIPPGSVFIS